MLISYCRSRSIGRTQCVVLDVDASSELPVSSGVPQGSVLGPILFVLYTNDLPNNIHSNVHLFANDAAVYLPVQSQEDSVTLQNDLINSSSGKRHETWCPIRPSVSWCCTYPGIASLSKITTPCMDRSSTL